MPRVTLQEMLDEIRFDWLPANWDAFDIGAFSHTKTLWDYRAGLAPLRAAWISGAYIGHPKECDVLSSFSRGHRGDQPFQWHMRRWAQGDEDSGRLDRAWDGPDD